MNKDRYIMFITVQILNKKNMEIAFFILASDSDSDSSIFGSPNIHIYTIKTLALYIQC